MYLLSDFLLIFWEEDSYFLKSFNLLFVNRDIFMWAYCFANKLSR